MFFRHNAVNTASRVEGLNKVLATSVLLTDASRQELVMSPVVDVLVDKGALMGFKLMGLSDLRYETASMRGVELPHSALEQERQ